MLGHPAGVRAGRAGLLRGQGGGARRRPAPWSSECTSAPPSSSIPTRSPVATSTTSGDVTARHVPRSCTTRSEAAERNDEPPITIVAIGTLRPRRKRSVPGGTREKPAEPSVSGIRAPPVAPRYTIGRPQRSAWPKSLASRLLPIPDEEPRFTVMSSPATVTGRPSIVPWPPILPSPGVVSASSPRAERTNVPCSSNEPSSSRPAMCSRTFSSPGRAGARCARRPPSRSGLPHGGGAGPRRGRARSRPSHAGCLPRNVCSSVPDS